ncbi:LysR family transcriptional regulator [Rhodobacteraceae bacterium 2CG4]|uniref:LysR family transcriptional regulator n=1 Tax=Halovulum marinum TaxID=2662447 RepID=A0A6L5YWT6_9RHOB|nr:LysR family transcriptional regulator [Halovulum marinum]MSU88325.1 LysR family transcriptional regulator [Halovulum marinum]
MKHATPDPSWDDLKVFLACARALSFRAAAKKLGLTSSTVVRRISALEEELGFQLFDRLPNGVQLTREASRLVSSANQIEQGAFDFQRRIETFDPNKRGIVRIAATEGIGSYWLMPRLIEFQRGNPMMVIDLKAAEVPVDVSRMEADVAIQFAEPQNPHVMRRRLASLHVYPYASRRYIDVYGVPQSRAEMLDHRLVDQVGPQLDQGAWPRYLGIEDIEGVVGIRTNSSAAHFYAVERGAGIGGLPTFASALGADLVPIDIGVHHRIDIWMTYHPDARRTPRIATIIDWLIGAFDASKYPWFRDEFIHPSAFGEFDSRHWQDSTARGFAATGNLREIG